MEVHVQRMAFNILRIPHLSHSRSLLVPVRLSVDHDTCKKYGREQEGIGME